MFFDTPHASVVYYSVEVHTSVDTGGIIFWYYSTKMCRQSGICYI